MLRRLLVVLLIPGVVAACRTSVTGTPSPGPGEAAPAAGAPPSAALPEGIQGVDPELLEPGPWEFAAYYTGESRPYARFRTQDWTVHTLANRLRLGVKKKVGMGASFSADGIYEVRDYDFDGPVEALENTDDPITIVNGFGGRFRYIQPFHPEWAAFAGGRARLEAERGAPLTDGFSWAAYLGVGHRTSFGLEVGVGVGYLERPGGETFWIPVVQGSWEIDDVLTLSLDGIELEAEARTSEQWAWALAVYFDSARIRLTDDPPGNSGIFTDSRFTVDVRARWTPVEDLDFELRLGMDVWRKLFFSDRDGNSLAEFGLKPAPVLAARITVRF